MGVMTITRGALDYYLVKDRRQVFASHRARVAAALDSAVSDELGTPHRVLDFWYDYRTGLWVVDLDEAGEIERNTPPVQPPEIA